MLEGLAQQYAGKIAFRAMDAYQNMDLTSTLGVVGLPTVILFKAGREVGRFVGAVPREKIVAALQAAGLA